MTSFFSTNLSFFWYNLYYTIQARQQQTIPDRGDPTYHSRNSQSINSTF